MRGYHFSKRGEPRAKWITTSGYIGICLRVWHAASSSRRASFCQGSHAEQARMSALPNSAAFLKAMTRSNGPCH